MDIIFKIQGHLAACHRASDSGEWIFTCCRQGLSELLGRKVKNGEIIKADLLAVEKESFLERKNMGIENTRLDINGEFRLSAKKAGTEEVFLPEIVVPIKHVNTPVYTLNALQRALADALKSLADQSDGAITRLKGNQDAVKGVLKNLSEVAEGDEVVATETGDPDYDGTHAYRINFGVVKKISSLVWQCSNKPLATAIPIGSVDDGMYQLLPALAGVYVVVRFDPATPPSFLASDPPSKPVNFTVELVKNGVILDTVEMTGTRVKGGFGLAGGDKEATQSIAITPTQIASCQVSLRF